MIRGIAAVLLSSLFSFAAVAASEGHEVASENLSPLGSPEWTGDAFPLLSCPATGYRLGLMGDPVVITDRGREIRLCCDVCRLEINSKGDEYHEKIDREIIRQQKPFYPLTTCLVTGTPLESGDGPVDFVYKNRLFRFHSEACIADFLKDPPRYVQLHEAAVRELAGRARSQPKLCPVNDQKLSEAEHPVSFVVGQQLVRLYSEQCVAEFESDPGRYLEKIRAAVIR